MNSNATVELAAAKAALTAAILDTGSPLWRGSNAILLLALAVGLLGRPLAVPACILAAALAVVQGYFAWRVRFDASVFRGWSLRWRGDADPAADLAAFDRILGRNTPQPGTLDVAADLARRRRGAIRLLIMQILLAAAQSASIGAALYGHAGVI